MKTRFIQRMMAGALTAALVAAPSMSALAAGTSDSVSGGASEDVIVTEDVTVSVPVIVTVEEEVLDIINESIAAAPVSVDVNNDNSVSAVSSIAEVPVTNTVAGTKSTTQGVYLASSVSGTAITSDLQGIADSYKLGSGEVPYARFSNMDVKKSVLAKAAIDDTAAAIGATVGPCINIELGKKANGKFSLLSEDGDKIAIKVGIPKGFKQADTEYAVICVRPGGVVSVLEDTDSDPDTVTIETAGGQGAYAIVRY